MKKKIKIAALIGLSGIVGVSATIVPVAILNQYNYSIKKQKEQEKQQQIELYKDVDEKKLLDAININIEESSKNNYDSSMVNYSSEENNIQKQGVNNFIENKEKILELSLKVKSGDLLTSDILKEQEKYKSQNIDEYNKIIQEYNLSVEDNVEHNNVELLNSFENYMSVSTFGRSTNYVEKNKEENPKVLFTDEQIQNIIHIKNLSLAISIFDIANKTISGMSLVLNVVAFGVAAFYWSAWWMFGTNIPFAIAATLQATTMLVFNGFAIYDMVMLAEQIKNSEGIFGNKDIENTSDNIIINSLSIINSVGSLDASRNLIKKNIYKWLQKVSQKSSGNIIKRISNKLAKEATSKIAKILVQNSILSSTSWVNPIAPFISVISNSLSTLSILSSVCSLVSNIALSAWV